MARLTSLAAIALILLAPVPAASQDAPRILLDQPARIVEYQLNRLTDAQLVTVERRDTDPRYRPVYLALLTRPDLAMSYRDEALAALVKLSNASPVAVLFEALGRVPFDDPRPVDGLVMMMAAQPVDRLRGERSLLTAWFAQPDVPSPVLRGAFAGLLADGESPAAAWQFADARSGSLIELLRAVAALPRDRLPAVAAALVSRVEAVVAAGGTDASTRSAGVEALARLRPNQATVATLADVLRSGPAAGLRAATITALLAMPDAAWSAAPIDELAVAVTAGLAAMPTAERTESAGLAAMALGERLATRLPAERARAVRRDLRALGVRVVRLETLPEQVSFDLRWFVVEAGKPVQIVLVNPDAMPHNVVIGRPGSLEAIGTAGNAMSMPSDPSAKPFVPDLPQVLFATRLVTQGQTESLGFTAPVEPGEYVFVCTFPGHWVRMYGVMLVVPDLDAFEAAPTPPSDPITRQRYSSPRNP